MYYDDPLYIEIMRETAEGDLLTVNQAVARWHRDRSHTGRVLAWMSDAQTPKPMMARVANASPDQWRRINADRT